MKVHIEFEIEKCQQCRHIDHSGSFTAGGARPICGHSDACVERKTKAEFAGEYPMYAKEFDGDFKYHWFNRIVSRDSIPNWCPLKHGSKY